MSGLNPNQSEPDTSVDAKMGDIDASDLPDMEQQQPQEEADRLSPVTFIPPVEGTPAAEALAANKEIKVSTITRGFHKLRGMKRPKLKNFNLVKKLNKTTKTKRKKKHFSKNFKGKVINGMHELYTLTAGIMLGIRFSVGQSVRHAAVSDILTVPDFHHVENVVFPPKGSLPYASYVTPPHDLAHTFKFKSYAPRVFHRIREYFDIPAPQYQSYVCGDYNFIEFISNSKSGQFFFYSHDGQYMLKTQTKEENKFMLRILPHYYQYLTENPNSLLVRILGMHRIKMYHLRRKVHFVVMTSVFDTPALINTIYDLKGSRIGRSATKKERESGGVLKDNDLVEDKRKFHFGSKKPAFMAQLKKDAEFLAQLNIMDYSLLIGVHSRSNRMNPASTVSVSIEGGGGGDLAASAHSPMDSPTTVAGGNSAPATAPPPGAELPPVETPSKQPPLSIDADADPAGGGGGGGGGSATNAHQSSSYSMSSSSYSMSSAVTGGDLTTGAVGSQHHVPHSGHSNTPFRRASLNVETAAALGLKASGECGTSYSNLNSLSSSQQQQNGGVNISNTTQSFSQSPTSARAAGAGLARQPSGGGGGGTRRNKRVSKSQSASLDASDVRIEVPEAVATSSSSNKSPERRHLSPMPPPAAGGIGSSSSRSGDGGGGGVVQVGASTSEDYGDQGDDEEEGGGEEYRYGVSGEEGEEEEEEEEEDGEEEYDEEEEEDGSEYEDIDAGDSDIEGEIPDMLLESQSVADGEPVLEDGLGALGPEGFKLMEVLRPEATAFKKLDSNALASAGVGGGAAAAGGGGGGGSDGGTAAGGRAPSDVASNATGAATAGAASATSAASGGTVHGGSTAGGPVGTVYTFGPGQARRHPWTSRRDEGINSRTHEGKRGDEIYFLGVIDILQQYNASKRTETYIKSVTSNNKLISSVDPYFYAKRFIDFMDDNID